MSIRTRGARRAALIAAGAALAGLAFVPAASAQDPHAPPPPTPSGAEVALLNGVLTYTADPGGMSNAALTSISDAASGEVTVTVTDSPTFVLRAEGACSEDPLLPNRVTCASAGPISITVKTGDEPDRVNLEGLSLGAVVDGGSQSDTIEGGPGRDTIDYSGRTTEAVEVDLPRGRGGAAATGAGEFDRLSGIENVRTGGGDDTIRVRDTSRNEVACGDGQGDHVAADALDEVGADCELLEPVGHAPPSISGTATEGQTLAAHPGAWGGRPTPLFAFQWLRCDADGTLRSCHDIAGAVADTYTLRSADVGRALRVRVTATNRAGSQTATSDPSAPVAGLPVELAPRDLKPPSVFVRVSTRQSLRTVARRGLVLSARCSEVCDLNGLLLLDPRMARKLKLARSPFPLVIGSGSARSTGGMTRVTVRPAGRRVRRALARLRRVRLTLTTFGTDLAGNAGADTRRVTLRR